MNQSLINELDSTKLIGDFIKYASRELGEIKVSETIKKVESSDKVQSFLLKARSINQQLGSDDFLACIHSSIKFTFAKPEVISIATVWLLNLWNNKIGIPNEITSGEYLKNRFFTILQKCDKYKIHINSSDNFFERFYTYIQSSNNKVVEDKNDPYYWIILAIEAVSNYKIGFERNKPVWDDFTFNCFLLNCGFIYFIEFPEEIEQIGWDNSNPVKNKFNELILKLSLDFFNKKERATGMQIEEKFENIDDVDSCIKYFAYYIKRFIIRQDVEYMHMIVYNVCHTFISKEFNHVGHEGNKNMTETADFAGKFGNASEFIGNKII
jgi:hypothetical protein